MRRSPVPALMGMPAGRASASAVGAPEASGRVSLFPLSVWAFRPAKRKDRRRGTAAGRSRPEAFSKSPFFFSGIPPCSRNHSIPHLLFRPPAVRPSADHDPSDGPRSGRLAGRRQPDVPHGPASCFGKSFAAAPGRRPAAATAGRSGMLHLPLPCRSTTVMKLISETGK
jgi:hypothetical protein